MTYIGREAFGHCASLREIRLPDKVRCIESETFSLCRELAYIQFPKELIEIRKEAFSGCDKLEFFHFPENRKAEIRDMLAYSGFEYVVHSPLEYTEMSFRLLHYIKSEDYDELPKILSADCRLVWLGKDTKIGRKAVVDFFKTFNEEQKEDGESYTIDITLSEIYERDCLQIQTHNGLFKSFNLLFTIKDDLIIQIVCGNMDIHNRNSKKYPWHIVAKCLKKNPLKPKPHQMPCMKCGLPSEELQWLTYAEGGPMGGHEGVMSVCPNCHEEVQFQETLHYRCSH